MTESENADANMVPVGEVVAQALAGRGWTQVEFAEILGRPPQFVSEIISGKKEITRESAAQIGVALDREPEELLALQDRYLLWRQSANANNRLNLDEVRLRAQLNSLGPMSILVKRGFIRSTNPHKQEKEICELYDIPSIYDEPSFVIAARRSNNDEGLTPTQKAWTACIRSRARSIDVGPYDPAGLKALASRLPRHLTSASQLVDLPRQFATVGVRIAYVESFPSSKLDGCSMMMGNTPTIGISGRGKRLDKVIFTILHEAAHITLGHLGKSGVIVDDPDSARHTLGTEEPADQQAADWIFPTPLPAIPGKVSYGWIESVAATFSVHPIVVIGRYQKMGLIDWRTTLVRGAPTIGDELDAW